MVKTATPPGQSTRRISVLVNGPLTTDHQQVDEVVDVGQAPAVPRRDGDLAVQAQRLDVLARRLDVRRVGVEAVDEEAVVGPQRRRESAVAAADVDDHAALDAGGCQNLTGLLLFGTPDVLRRGPDRQSPHDADEPHAWQCDGSHFIPPFEWVCSQTFSATRPSVAQATRSYTVRERPGHRRAVLAFCPILAERETCDARIVPRGSRFLQRNKLSPLAKTVAELVF